MKTLLHICCAPCSLMCIESLRKEGREVSGFWYNPNIHPFTEYRSRRETLKTYAAEIGMPLFLRYEYGLRHFLSSVYPAMENRCATCYSLRLFASAAFAKENGFDSFTTSLLISPYQNFEQILQTGRLAGDQYGVRFLERDFRPLFREGQQRTKEKGFYMQKYCGCIFSEEERYCKKKK